MGAETIKGELVALIKAVSVLTDVLVKAVLLQHRAGGCGDSNQPVKLSGFLVRMLR